MARAKVNPVRVTVRDGRPVLIKRCQACGKDKVVANSKAEGSEFAPCNRRPDGTVKCWVPRCHLCEAARTKQLRRENYERYRQYERATLERIKADPERLAIRRAQTAEADRRWRARMSEEQREKERQRARASYQAKKAQDPTYHSRARKRERARQRQFERTARIKASGLKPTEPFERYLLAYGYAIGAVDDEGEINAAQVAYDLGIDPRRVTAVLAGECRQIAVDIVDQAVVNARMPIDVQVNGTPVKTTVFEIGDLYELAV